MRHLTITLSLALGLIAPLVLTATVAAQPLDYADAITAAPAARPSTSTPNAATDAVAVTIDNSHITSSAQRLQQGPTTLIIRNASRSRSTLIIAHGTTASLRYLPFPVPYLPIERIVRRVNVSSGGHARLTLTLTPGRYLLVASPPQTTMVRSATRFDVS
jgi:hypothetical protein